MYADKDSRGLISVFEMDRPEWSALRGACQMAVQLWEVQLMEFAGLESARMQTWEIQRKFHLEQNIGIARKLIFEIDRLAREWTMIPAKRIFESADNGQAIDLFDL